MVCGNIVCTGTFSTWSNVYGTAADGFIDMEFVDRKGDVFRAGDKSAPNVFAFEHAVVPSPGICTRAVVRLHPMTDDEEGVLVPFADLGGAVRLAHELGRRGSGWPSRGLGRHYIANFLSPSRRWPSASRTKLPRVLGMGMPFSRQGRLCFIRKMAGPSSTPASLRTLTLGFPVLWTRSGSSSSGAQGGTPPVELLVRPDSAQRSRPGPSPRLATPSAKTSGEPMPGSMPGRDDRYGLAEHVPDRQRPDVPAQACSPSSLRSARRWDAIDKVISGFARIAEAHGIDHDFGFLTPMDLGKRAILEYDYYLDHTDAEERARIGRAMVEIDPWLDRMAETTKGLISLKYVFSQGCSRKEAFLYR
jgi:hypothetical protein